jgi:hypothetical protein
MLTQLIDLKKYPIDRPESAEYLQLVKELREQLSSGDMLNMEGFLTIDGTEAIAQEIDSLVPVAYHSARRAGAYGIVDSDGLPDDHPYNIKSATDRYGLGRHQLKHTLLDSIYMWEPLRHFVRDLLKLNAIYLHEDPSNALVVQIYKNKGGLAWHFDRALFSTILNIKESADGGVFECVPNLRTDSAPCFDDVRDVLLDRSERVERYSVKPGSFTIMLGRYTLHRVTENLGDTPRYSAVLSYEDVPGVKLDAPTRKTFFGPSAPS